MPDITIAAGGTAKQLAESSFDNARDGTGEGTGGQAAETHTGGFGGESMPAATVLYRRDGQKLPGPTISNTLSLFRYFMIFTIPSSTNYIAQASIKLTSAGYATDSGGGRPLSPVQSAVCPNSRRCTADALSPQWGHPSGTTRASRCMMQQNQRPPP